MRTPHACVPLALMILGGVEACAPPRRPTDETDRYFGALPDPTGENVLLTVETIEVDAVDAYLLDAAWVHATEEDDRLSVPPACRPNGLRIGVGSPALRGELTLARASAASSRRTETLLTVLNGRSGLIQITEVQAAPVTLLTWDGRLERHVNVLVRPQAALEARPERIGGDKVRLDLTPVVGSQEPGGQTLTLTELRTTVVVPRGVPVLIGAHEQEAQNFGNTFFATRSGREQRRRLVLVTAK